MKCYWLLMFLDLVFGQQRTWMSTDDLENFINPDDLKQFMTFYASSNATTPAPTTASVLGETTENPTTTPVPGYVDCFGLGSLTRQLPWLFNMQPQSSEKINTHFFFMSRKQPMRVQVLPGPQFGLEWVDYNATRKTVMIIHGFMSHSNASWVRNMTKAFLEWDDVNVITVDWSRGGNTWKYWRAVANTRRVGSDVAGFLRQLMKATGASMKDFHLIGHSLGAHICSYASYQIGGVRRITGLDPAQPCFRTTDVTERLDLSDAEFVDVIHTNGRLLKKIGFGLPDPAGHADFYPNGGMKQPGCRKNEKKGLWASLLSPIFSIAMVVFTGKLFNIQFFKPFIEESFHLFELEQAICSHGRAYVLFTESILSNNCTFRAHRWNLTYEGVNASLEAACDRVASCSEMGIRADGAGGALPQAEGAYFTLTAESEPYCPSEAERRHPSPHLLNDLQQGFRIDPSQKPAPKVPKPDTESTTELPTTTTKASWLARLFG